MYETGSSESNVAKALNLTISEVTRANELLELLSVRLAPVLRNDPLPKDPSDTMNDEPLNQSPVAETTLSLNIDVSRLCNRINELLYQLDV